MTGNNLIPKNRRFSFVPSAPLLDMGVGAVTEPDQQLDFDQIHSASQ